MFQNCRPPRSKPQEISSLTERQELEKTGEGSWVEEGVIVSPEGSGATSAGEL